MTKPKPDYSADDLYASLRELLAREDQAEGMTTKEWSAKLNTTERQMQRLLAQLYEEGRVETSRVRRRSYSGLRSFMVHRILPAAE